MPNAVRGSELRKCKSWQGDTLRDKPNGPNNKQQTNYVIFQLSFFFLIRNKDCTKERTNKRNGGLTNQLSSIDTWWKWDSQMLKGLQFGLFASQLVVYDVKEEPSGKQQMQ